MSIKRAIAPWGKSIAKLVDELAAGGIPSDATTVYEGRNRVARIIRDNRAISIKAFKVPNLINRLAYTTLRKSKAVRSYQHALMLRNLGFNTPEPLAWVEERRGLLLGHSYYVCQHLDGFRDLRVLDRLVKRGVLADDLGALMARLHEHGVWMKDFSQGNLLYRTTPKGRYEFFLIDINRMEFDVSDRHKLMTNFRAITEDASFRRILIRAYARHAHLPEAKVTAEANAALAAFERKWRRKRRIKQILNKIKSKS